jgi:ribosomal protein L37AE/L43A
MPPVADDDSKVDHFHYNRNENGLYVCPYKGCQYPPQRLMQTMHYHLRKHQENLPHVCNKCKKGFLHKKTLELHMIAQHNEKKPPAEEMYHCPIPGCSFNSLTKGNCRIHLLRIHMKTKVAEYLDRTDTMWNCKACNQEFKNSTGFYYHVAECLPQQYVSAPPIRKALGLKEKEITCSTPRPLEQDSPQ